MFHDVDVVCEMEGVREYVEGSTVKLVRRQPDGRLAIRAYNEGGNNYTDIDLFDLEEWLRKGPMGGLISDGDPDE